MYHPQGLLSASEDKRIIIWDVIHGAIMRVLVGHTRAVMEAVMLEDEPAEGKKMIDRRLVSSSEMAEILPVPLSCDDMMIDRRLVSSFKVAEMLLVSLSCDDIETSASAVLET